jgi:hypothetical protein
MPPRVGFLTSVGVCAIVSRGVVLGVSDTRGVSIAPGGVGSLASVWCLQPAAIRSAAAAVVAASNLVFVM